MPYIKYVCLSDTHFGDEGSLLTNLKTASPDPDPLEPGPVLMKLVDCLRYLIEGNGLQEKPTLILNGDILELALTTDNQAFMVFERFMELIMPRGRELFEKIIYIPGNHDHHLWELARETQFVNYLKKIKTGTFLPIPWHTTNMFIENDPNPVPSFTLTNIVQRYDHLKAFDIITAYPNFGLFRRDVQKCAIFHHGHFIESLYLLMSTVRNLIFANRKEPDNIWDIEAENFAWIDFFWSTLGRSGDVGQDVELIYKKLQDKEQFKKLLYSLADNLAERYDLPAWGDKMEAQLLKWLFDYAVERGYGTERKKIDRPLSEDVEKGFRSYMNGPLRAQIMTENNGNAFSDVTFVFGHTHKPFQEDMDFEHYPERVNVYNTGGWVVDTVDPEPLHGGAVVLVDEGLNAVSINMYYENAEAEKYSVSLKEAAREDGRNSPFYQKLVDTIDPRNNPWKSFSETVAGEVKVRQQNLREQIDGQS